MKTNVVTFTSSSPAKRIKRLEDTISPHPRFDSIASGGTLFNTDSPCSPSTSIMQTIIVSAKRFDPRRQLEPGSRRASTITVITSMVGCGTLALPNAMMKAGLIPTVSYLIMVGVMCSWTLYALILIGQHTEANTFYDIAKALFGGRIAICIEVMIITMLLLVSVAYLALIKNLLPTVLQWMFHFVSYLDTGYFLLPMVVLILISPLALKRRVAALRYSSLVGLLLVAYLTVITIIKFVEFCNTTNECVLSVSRNESPIQDYPLAARKTIAGINSMCWVDKLKLFERSWGGHFYTLPVILTSYSAHPTILPIYFELQTRSPKEMWIVISSALTITTCVYILLSLFGYFTFLSDTKPNYLTNDYRGDISVLIAGFGLCLVTSFGVPLLIHAARRSIVTLYYAGDGCQDSLGLEHSCNIRTPLLKQPSNVTSQNTQFRRNLAGNLVPTPGLSFALRRPQLPRERSSSLPAELPFYSHIGLTMGILALVTVGAQFVPNIGVIMAFIGSTILPTVCYIFPTIALWRLRQIVPKDVVTTKVLTLVTCSALVVLAIVVGGLTEEIMMII